jgi:ABC-type transport system involved in multi-copper enzyme maturation permease subunit
MIITLMWKEYREQRSVWLALPAFTALMVVAVWWLLEQSGPMRSMPSRRDALMGLAVVLGATYGLVSGAMLLANERESGTLVFLDALTGRRAPLWWSKLLAGVVLTLAHSLLLVAAVVLFMGGELDDPLLLIAWLAVLTWTSLSGLAWGLWMSACFSNVLAAAASAVSAFGLSLVVAGLLSALVEYLFKGSAALMFVACQSGATLAALEGSRRVFCGSDRSRAHTSVDLHDGGHGGPAHAWRGWGALLWLVYQQGRTVVWALLAGALLLTLGMATGDLVAWPLISGVIGIACGLCTFAPEQAAGAGRFLGVQRLPPGRVWMAKVAAWFAIACVIAALALLLEAIVHLRELSHLADTIESGGLVTVLFLWLTFGFAAGQLLTLLVRKTAIAALLASVLAGGLVLLLLPSLVVGGMRAWQWLGVPAVLLLAGRSSVWPWWSGTLGNRRSLLPLAGCGVLAAGWLAIHLGWRVIEVPDVGQPFDVAAFEASLPTPEQNQTGRLIRRAAQEGDLEQLRKAAHLPAGMITDPRVPDAQLPAALEALRKAAARLRTEANELLLQGEHGAALDIIVDLLALSRQVRRHAPAQVCRTGVAIEAQALEALEHWQAQTRGEPKLVARALNELLLHEAQLPPPADQVKATYLAFRAELDLLNGAAFSFPQAAFQAPWERARLERFGNAWFAGWVRAAESEPWMSAACVASVWRHPWVQATQGPGADLTIERLSDLLERSPVVATLLDPYAPWPGAAQALRKVRLAELRLARVLYWSDHWPEKYEEQPANYLILPPPPMKLLVPRYLPAVPIDPLKGQPLEP